MGEEQVPKRSVQVLSGSVPERSVSHRDPQAPGRPDLRDVRRDFAQFAVGVGRCEPFESLRFRKIRLRTVHASWTGGWLAGETRRGVRGSLAHRGASLDRPITLVIVPPDVPSFRRPRSLLLSLLSLES